MARRRRPRSGAWPRCRPGSRRDGPPSRIVRPGGRSVRARPGGQRRAPVGRHAWCRPGRAPRPSRCMRASRRRSGASGSEISTARLSGVVNSRCGGSARCRARLLAGVSPVRASTVTGRRISCTGRERLRAISVARALSGLTYSVCRPGRGLAARSIRLGRKPASVLPPPVGAISSTLSRASAACSIASWCGRGVHPCAANQPAKGSGIVPAMAGHKHDAGVQDNAQAAGPMIGGFCREGGRRHAIGWQTTLARVPLKSALDRGQPKAE